MSTVITPFQGTDPFSTATFNNRISQINTGFSHISNPNLLDNWYFGNPVDQRQGRVVVPNTTYYSDNQLTTAAGTTSAYVTAYRYANGTASGVNYASFKLTDTDAAPTYYAAPANVVRGYTGRGYGIDMWLLSDNIAVLVENDGLVIFAASNSNLTQYCEFPFDALAGKIITITALTADNQLLSATGTVPSSAPSGNTLIANLLSSDFGRLQFRYNGKFFFTFVPLAGKSKKFVASAIDIGDHQTHFSKDADGKWQLNELPNYADTLARCQYYSDLPTTWEPMTFYVADFIVFTVKTHREMRVNLSSANVTLDASKLEVRSNGVVQSGFTFSVYGGGDDFILVKAAKSGHGLSNAMLIVNNGGIYANANL